jgi:dipeptidyl-peptidase-4
MPGSLRRSLFVLLPLCVPLAAPVAAQGTNELTLATVLARGAALAPSLPTTLWQPGGHSATVIVTAPDGNQTLHAFADGKLVEAPLADAKALQKALGASGDGPTRFPAMRWHDAQTLRLDQADGVRLWKPGDATVTPWLLWPAGDAATHPTHALSPDDQRVVVVREHQLWLHERSGRTRQLTFDGSRDVVYGGAAHRAEFGIDRGLFWSADGRFLAFYREDQRGIAPYPYQDLAAMPPQPIAGRYPMAGRTHSKVTVGVLDTTDLGVRWLEHDAAEDVYWTNLTFGPEHTLHTARVGRGQDHLELVRYAATTGKRLAVLLEERDPEWVEPEHGPLFLADGAFLWWSSRSGHRHLWLHRTGAEPLQVTQGAFDVQRVLGLASDQKAIWFEASGEDPRQCHLFRANLDGSEVRQVTRERGTHHAALSPDAQWAHVVWSNLETRPNARHVDLQNGTVVPLPAAHDPLANVPLPTQRMFQLKAEDDTVLYGHVALPPNLADGERCPVLLYVYGGPHVQLVTDRWFGGAPLWLQALAAEGYVVCRLDNRGTPHRGIAFEQAVHRRLGILEVQDQLRAVEWLAQQPFVDPQRIGVHGWSYGGYMTLRLLLAAPTTFACGVSGAPVTDWTMYETGYTERYLDGPGENKDGYQLASCLPFVDKLQRPLLLVHGTDDKTVMWSHSLAFVERCVQAGKQIDYFPYPMQDHALAGAHKKHFLQLLHDWLGRHLRPQERLRAPKQEPPPTTPPAPTEPRPETPPQGPQ